MADQRLEQLALQVLDRAAIDWDAVLSGCLSEEDRRAVQALRALAAWAEQSSQDTLDQSPKRHAPPDSRKAPAVSVETDRDFVRWGPYQLKGVIGRGAWGEVYRGWDPRLQREVAVKLALGDERQLLREARAMASVSHPNFVAVYEVARNARRTGIVMPWIHGQTLQQFVEARGPIESGEAATMGVELLEALHQLHQRVLLHRDIKPQNVMLDHDGRAILMDLGLAAPRYQPGQRGLAGTPLFLAPEVLAGAPHSVATDLYSMGAVLFFLVAASLPVQAASLHQLRSAHATGEARPLNLVRPGLDHRFASVVQSALSFDPGTRPPSALEMARALRASGGFLIRVKPG